MYWKIVHIYECGLPVAHLLLLAWNSIVLTCCTIQCELFQQRNILSINAHSSSCSTVTVPFICCKHTLVQNSYTVLYFVTLQQYCNCCSFFCPGTESCIRLVDVDQDGKLDIIFSVARLLNTSIDDLFHDNSSRRSFDELCHQRGQCADGAYTDVVLATLKHHVLLQDLQLLRCFPGFKDVNTMHLKKLTFSIQFRNLDQPYE